MYLHKILFPTAAIVPQVSWDDVAILGAYALATEPVR